MFFFGAKFGTIAKSENDMRDMRKVFFSFYQKNCHKSRVKRSCWSHFNCLFLEVAKKVVGFFYNKNLVYCLSYRHLVKSSYIWLPMWLHHKIEKKKNEILH
jgi:hypothetical protein